MAGYSVGTLGTLLEAIKETRHFRPQGTRKTTEKWREREKKWGASGLKFYEHDCGVCMCVRCACTCVASLSRSRAKLQVGMVTTWHWVHVSFFALHRNADALTTEKCTHAHKAYLLLLANHLSIQGLTYVSSSINHSVSSGFNFECQLVAAPASIFKSSVFSVCRGRRALELQSEKRTQS